MYARYCKRRSLGLLVAAQRYDDMEVVCCKAEEKMWLPCIIVPAKLFCHRLPRAPLSFTINTTYKSQTHHYRPSPRKGHRTLYHIRQQSAFGYTKLEATNP
jgi:hypothetical protein